MFFTKRARSWIAILLLASVVSGCRSAQTPTTYTTTPADERAMIWPDPLQPGDTIMFVAPAGDLNEERILQAKTRLEARGYRVVMRQDLFAREGYLAGPDDGDHGSLFAELDVHNLGRWSSGDWLLWMGG